MARVMTHTEMPARYMGLLKSGDITKPLCSSQGISE